MENTEQIKNMIDALVDGNDDVSEIEFRKFIKDKIKTTLGADAATADSHED